MGDALPDRWCQAPASATVAAAASGPDSSKTLNPASSRTLTPRVNALSYLVPGFSPTTTNEVFFDTEPLTFAPRRVSSSAAPSRVNAANVPVTTTLNPSRGLGPSGRDSTTGTTPASCHLRMISRCQSTANHSTIAASGRTPGD